MSVAFQIRQKEIITKHSVPQQAESFYFQPVHLFVSNAFHKRLGLVFSCFGSFTILRLTNLHEIVLQVKCLSQ